VWIQSSSGGDEESSIASKVQSDIQLEHSSVLHSIGSRGQDPHLP